MSNITVNNITPLSGVGGTVSISGSLFVTGSITAEGHINLGDSDLDSIYFGAEVSSSIIPNADNTYDLGSSTKEWQDLYVDGVAYIDTLANYSGSIQANTVVNVSSSLVPSVDGAFDLGAVGTAGYFGFNFYKRFGLVATQVLTASFARIVGEPHGQSFPTASLIVSGAGLGNVDVRFQDLPTSAPPHSGSLWLSGSAGAGTSKFLLVVV